MKANRIILVALALCTLGFQQGKTRAASRVVLEATGISIPFFNGAGTLTHRLTADRGTLAGVQQHLAGVELVYFSTSDPTAIVRRVQTVEATWDQAREVLEGRGAILVESEDTQLTGEGFHFTLGTGKLKIHRNFTMTNPDVVLSSDEAIVDFVIDRAGDDVKVRDVKRCEAFGNLHVVVQAAAKTRYRFDEVFSDRAIYDGASHTISLPNDVRVRRNGSDALTRKLDIVLDQRTHRKRPRDMIRR